MPPSSKALPTPLVADPFEVDQVNFGGVSVLRMRGTLNEAFEGRKLAEATRSKKLVVSMRKVRRFASWGMTEWMDFLRVTAGREVYLVECSAYAVSQINLITGLLGHARLVSFYASFRCQQCNQEIETLFLIPRDRAEIRDLPGSHQQCSSCGGQAPLEEYPAAFFETISSRPPFDIDDEVLAFFRAELGYDLSPDLTRFRAHRRVKNDYTYLRLTGSMSLLTSEPLVAAVAGTTVVDVGGLIFDPAEVTGWRTFIEGALPKVTSMQLLNCPPGFLEASVALEDLHDKLKVRTFALAYECLRCNTAIPYMVDVAENLEHLAGGVAPPARCPTCQSPLLAALTPAQAELVRALPARERDAALDAFLAKTQGEPADKLENCLIAAPKKRTSGGGPSRAVYLALGLAILLLGGVGALALTLWKDRPAPTAGSGAAVVTPPPPPPQPQFTRPDWILADVPSSAYCHEMINRLMCVGVSTYRATRDDAVAEANDAALEELVSAIGLKIADPEFRENVVPGYSTVRAKALSTLQAADLDRYGAAYAEAADVVRKARRRVTEVFQASGGAAVPSQRSDWYWEEYAGEQGRANEVLVFVRYDVSVDALKALVEKYSTTISVQGSSAMTAFPAVAWQSTDFAGGALLTKVGRPFTGIAPQSVVMAVGGQRVADAPGFARRIEEWKQGAAELELTVKTGDTPVRVVKIKR